MNEPKGSVKVFKPYSLEFPTWLWGTGFSKGIFHDRQSLGIILPAGASISIRRVSAINAVLNLDFLNDGSQTEVYIEVTDQWVHVTMVYASVPFIRTPYVPVDIELEYSTVGEHPLAIFHPHGDAGLFFQIWDQFNSAFALIQTTYVSLLVPAADKARVKELHSLEGLDSIEAYYLRLFESYNLLVGISFGTSVHTDKNVRNRYFVKADKGGGGGAYYGTAWAAQVGGSIAACWLDTRPDNWCSLHEIGHGYQTLAIYNSTVTTGEVWNNIFATYYQHEFMGDDIYARGWMYGGDAQRTFDEMRIRFEMNLPPSKWHFHEVLFLFMIIVDKAGKQAFSELNKHYRKMAVAEGFSYLEHSLMDLFMLRWAEQHNINIAPLMGLVELKVPDVLSLKLFHSNAAPCAPLYRFVSAEQLTSIQQRLKLKTPFSLVDCQALKVTDLKGDLTIFISGLDYEEHKNKSILLRDGSNMSRVVNISSREVLLKSLPVGVYAVVPPTGVSPFQNSSCHYVDVRAQMNSSVELGYVESHGTSLASQSIEFFGLYGKFATLSIDVKRHRAVFNVVQANPHSGFGPIPYAAVNVRDINGFVLFDLTIPAVGALLSEAEFSIAPGCTVRIYHRESSRLVELPKFQPFLDLTVPDNELEITSQGLRNLSLNNQPGDSLKDRIAIAVDDIRKNPHIVLHAGHPQIKDFLVAIETFDPVERLQFLQRYRDLIVLYSDTGGAVVSSGYVSWRLPGNGNFTVADIRINPVSQQIAIEVVGRLPHSLFQKVYLAIWVRTVEGRVLFSQEIRGDIWAEPSYTLLSFPTGSTVSVFHLEPTRAELVDTDTQARYPVEQIHIIRSLGDGKLQM